MEAVMQLVYVPEHPGVMHQAVRPVVVAVVHQRHDGDGSCKPAPAIRIDVPVDRGETQLIKRPHRGQQNREDRDRQHGKREFAAGFGIAQGLLLDAVGPQTLAAQAPQAVIGSGRDHEEVAEEEREDDDRNVERLCKVQSHVQIPFRPWRRSRRGAAPAPRGDDA